MKWISLLAGSLACFASTGCTSHSWTKVERTYAATYSEVFEKVPDECKKCEMKLKESKPEAGMIVLTAHRLADKVLTSSLINMFAGDEVIVKVQRVDPTTTKVFIDSKARGQIGPDLGRTDRNVTSLAGVLDNLWPQIGTAEEEKGEKRPGTSSQPSVNAEESNAPTKSD